MKKRTLTSSRRRRLKNWQIKWWGVILPLPLLTALLLLRAVIAWSALLNHGQTAEATVLEQSVPYRQGVRGGSSGTVKYEYAFWYRGARYLGVSTFGAYYPGEWPHLPYRVTFLPENPDVNDILPVNKCYVICKIVMPIPWLLLGSLAFLPLFTDKKQRKRLGIAAHRPVQAGGSTAGSALQDLSHSVTRLSK